MREIPENTCRKQLLTQSMEPVTTTLVLKVPAIRDRYTFHPICSELNAFANLIR